MRFFEDLYSQHKRPYGDGPSPVVVSLVELLEEGSKVLDIGCGTGRDCIYMAKKGMKVTGVDVSMRGIMAAQMWAREEGVEAEFLKKDLIESRLPEKEFNAIVCVNTLEYIDGRKRLRAAHEVYRMAAEGAHLAFMGRSTDDLDLRKGKDLGDNTWEVMMGLPIHFFTDRELKSMFPDFETQRVEVVTVNEPLPEPVDHRYWLFMGQRP